MLYPRSDNWQKSELVLLNLQLNSRIMEGDHNLKVRNQSFFFQSIWFHLQKFLALLTLISKGGINLKKKKKRGCWEADGVQKFLKALRMPSPSATSFCFLKEKRGHIARSEGRFPRGLRRRLFHVRDFIVFPHRSEDRNSHIPDGSALS